VEAVVGHRRSRALAQWLAMSTEPAPGGGVRFALDLEEIRALVTDYFRSDLWPTVAEPPGAARVHLVIAERSSSYSAEDTARARELARHSDRVTVDLLPTDHWVHAEDPEGVLRVLLERIP
jgi:pimeloyl-ACP methyl ester carboxylesterase